MTESRAVLESGMECISKSIVQDIINSSIQKIHCDTYSSTIKSASPVAAISDPAMETDELDVKVEQMNLREMNALQPPQSKINPIDQCITNYIGDIIHKAARFVTTVFTSEERMEEKNKNDVIVEVSENTTNRKTDTDQTDGEIMQSEDKCVASANVTECEVALFTSQVEEDTNGVLECIEREVKEVMEKCLLNICLIAPLQQDCGELSADDEKQSLLCNVAEEAGYKDHDVIFSILNDIVAKCEESLQQKFQELSCGQAKEISQENSEVNAGPQSSEVLISSEIPIDLSKTESNQNIQSESDVSRKIVESEKENFPSEQHDAEMSESTHYKTPLHCNKVLSVHFASPLADYKEYTLSQETSSTEELNSQEQNRLEEDFGCNDVVVPVRPCKLFRAKAFVADMAKDLWSSPECILHWDESPACTQDENACNKMIAGEKTTPEMLHISQDLIADENVKDKTTTTKKEINSEVLKISKDEIEIEDDKNSLNKENSQEITKLGRELVIEKAVPFNEANPEMSPSQPESSFEVVCTTQDYPADSQDTFTATTMQTRCTITAQDIERMKLEDVEISNTPLAPLIPPHCEPMSPIKSSPSSSSPLDDAGYDIRCLVSEQGLPGVENLTQIGQDNVSYNVECEETVKEIIPSSQDSFIQCNTSAQRPSSEFQTTQENSGYLQCLVMGPELQGVEKKCQERESKADDENEARSSSSQESFTEFVPASQLLNESQSQMSDVIPVAEDKKKVCDEVMDSVTVDVHDGINNGQAITNSDVEAKCFDEKHGEGVSSVCDNSCRVELSEIAVESVEKASKDFEKSSQSQEDCYVKKQMDKPVGTHEGATAMDCPKFDAFVNPCEGQLTADISESQSTLMFSPVEKAADSQMLSDIVSPLPSVNDPVQYDDPEIIDIDLFATQPFSVQHTQDIVPIRLGSMFNRRSQCVHLALCSDTTQLATLHESKEEAVEEYVTCQEAENDENIASNVICKHKAEKRKSEVGIPLTNDQEVPGASPAKKRKILQEEDIMDQPLKPLDDMNAENAHSAHCSFGVSSSNRRGSYSIGCRVSSPNFRWGYVPSVEEDDMMLPQAMMDEESSINNSLSLYAPSPLKTPNKARRVGLSRKHRGPTLHGNVCKNIKY